MNREAIRNTALERYDKSEKVWIVESPLLEICHGISPDKEEAWEIFDDLLNEMYIAYMEGTTVGGRKRGRPAKTGVDFHLLVRKETKDAIAKLADELKISQGESVDYLASFYRALQSRIVVSGNKAVSVNPKRQRASAKAAC